MKAPFGYYVPVDRNAQNVFDFFAWDEAREGENAGAFFNRRIKTAFHAWFATFPRETITRLVRNSSATRP